MDAPADDSDDSPEAEFARTFSKNYDEIGKYFPEFLRLRELLKIAAMNAIVSSIMEGMDDTLQDKDGKLRDLQQKLSGKQLSHLQQQWRKQSIDWPMAENSSKIDETAEEFLESKKYELQRQYHYPPPSFFR